MVIKRVDYSTLSEEWLPSKLLFSTEEPEYPVKLLNNASEINPDSRKINKDNLEDQQFKMVKLSSTDRKRGKIIAPEIVKKEGLTKRARLKAFKGDILIPLLPPKNFGPVLVTEEVIVSDNFAVVEPNINAYYLLWALRQDYVFKQIKAKSRGNTITRIPIKELKNVEVPYLDEGERKEKINLMKEEFKELSSREKALLYKENIEDIFSKEFGISKDQLSLQVLAKVNYQQFTKRTKWRLKPFLNRELKEIIYDLDKFEVYKLKEIVESVDAGANPYKSKEQKSVKIIKSKNVEVLIIDGPFKEMEVKSRDKYKLNSGDVLMPRKGSIGPTAVVTKQEEGMLFQDTLVRFKVDEELVNPEYLAIYLNSDLGKYLLDNYVSPGTIDYITLSDLKEVKVIFPSLNVQNEIIQKVKNI